MKPAIRLKVITLPSLSRRGWTFRAKTTPFCFQSRLGNVPWIGPYTSEVIKALAESGKKRILVFCPAFVSDCLETIYEIGVEYKAMFIAAGGEHLQLVESLNESPKWIEALKTMVG